MKFLDLFAGIGGFRLGMERAGHECVGYVEWDKYARKSYEAIHDTEGEWTAHDITKISDEEIRSLGERNIDVICGGFPCQSFSVAGKRMGFEDTRGTLFFEIARIAKEIKPRYLFLENVKGLLNHDKGNTFTTILRTLDELGYDVEWQVLNSKNFGVPQNRERVFIIGHLRGSGGREVFPIGRTDEATNLPVEIIAHRDGYRRNTQVFDPNGITEALDTGQGGGRGHYTAIPVLTPERTEKRQNGRRFKEDGEPMFTLTSQDRHGIMLTRSEIKRFTDTSHCLMARDYKGIGNQEMTGVLISEATKKGYTVAEEGDSVNFQFPDSKTRRGRVGKQIANTLEASNINQGVLVGVGHHPLSKKKEFNGYSDDVTPCLIATDYKAPKTAMFKNGEDYRIRKLTPKECFRLQSFPDWAFEKAEEVNSNSQLYKQAGNSVTVNVVYEIAKRLKKEEQQ